MPELVIGASKVLTFKFTEFDQVPKVARYLPMHLRFTTYFVCGLVASMTLQCRHIGVSMGKYAGNA